MGYDNRKALTLAVINNIEETTPRCDLRYNIRARSSHKFYVLLPLALAVVALTLNFVNGA